MAPKESSRSKHRHRDGHEESSRKHQHKKRRSKTSRPETSSDDSGSGRRSNALSANALAQLNREQARHKHRSERDKRVRREDYRAAAQQPDRLPREKHRSKKRVVSGAIVEEGRAPIGLRGGAWSEESYEKADFYQRPAPKKNRKKLCKLNRAFCV